MPLDAQSQAFVDAFRKGLGQGPFDLAAMRRGRRPAVPDSELRRGLTVEDRTIAGPGGDLAVRIYHPTEAAPLGILTHLHGGGFITGDLDSADAVCRHLCRHANCVVVNVDYRLAPEHPFPAGVEDAYAAFLWSVENAVGLGAPRGQVAVSGESAGGALAAAVCLMARDRNGPKPRLQLLIYPCINLKLETPERQAMARSGYILTPELMNWQNGLYSSEPSAFQNPYCAPVFATDLTGLPAALVITAEYDPLRFEAQAYAARLAAAGAPTTCSQYPGTVHAFVAAFAWIDKGREALAEAAAALRGAFTAK